MGNVDTIINEVKKAVIGKDELLHKILMVILAKGHILLEDIPGVGKTTLAVAFSKAMSLQSRRIQFTVDVLPSDVVGFTSLKHDSGEVQLHPGAIFCNIFLADEINRTTSKTQAALLEVMEEGSITIDGYTQNAPHPFCVIATQNPLGSAGTQQLPESQLDRFMVKLSIGYPDIKAETEILKRKGQPIQEVIHQVITKEEVISMQQEVEKVYIHDALYTYMIELVNATRKHPGIRQGASPRASISLMQLAKASAYVNQRDYVVPRDIHQIFYDVIAHRVIFQSEAMIESHQTILKEILHEVKLPQAQNI